jgi:uroporphyrin-III C-methyltransferase/precorrin-2 dehydrogenase/sirohydrochlorin ferrochelatase
VGFVSIIGAGPGDAELLTRKAASRLAEADLVLFDALVEPEVLALAPTAQKFSVGKRARRKAVSQGAIHALMIRAARRGRRVVRLKGGDPFVFGRGGEEALALTAAGIPFEVIPGVSNAVAAPALAGIPVTHRGVASGFLVLSAHAESSYGPIVDGLAPHSVTLVALMGLATRADLAARLLARGWRRQTPVAVVLAASTPREQVWIGNLGNLGEAPAALDDPGTIVIGEVVALRAAMAEGGGAPRVSGSQNHDVAREDGSDRGESWPARRGA